MAIYFPGVAFTGARSNTSHWILNKNVISLYWQVSTASSSLVSGSLHVYFTLSIILFIWACTGLHYAVSIAAIHTFTWLAMLRKFCFFIVSHHPWFLQSFQHIFQENPWDLPGWVMIWMCHLKLSMSYSLYPE